jgi:hypothetical protein
MLDAGLTEVGGEGRVFMNLGGSEMSNPLSQSPVRAALLATGMVTEAEIDAFLALLRDPTVALMRNILMAAWGRRPLEP